MKRSRSALLGAAVVGAAVLILFLQRREAPSPEGVSSRAAEIRLAHRTVQARGFPTGLSTNQSPSVRGTLPYALVSDSPVDKSLRQEIESCGARVIGVLSRKTLLIEADLPALKVLARHPRLAAATEFLPSDKVDGRLTGLLRSGPATVEVTVLSLAPADREPLRVLVVARGGVLLEGCLNGKDSFRAQMPAELVDELAKRGDVRWLESFSRPKLLNDFAVEPGAMNVRTGWNTHGLTGAGQVVSTSDSGIDTGDVATMHRDLASRVCGIGVVDGCYATDTNGHGTHTAGSIVGDGTMSDGTIRGTAYGAKLWVWFCNGTDGGFYTPATCEDLFRPDQARWPVFIHSASWGSRYGDGSYDDYCAEIDEYVWSHPDFLPVFACGNNGSHIGTVGSPAAAKNILTVGATQNARTWNGGWPSGDPTKTAGYSSRGPCQDGRIKPDVAAPGSGVLSTRAYACPYFYGIDANTNYAYNCGTSMATPLTAGTVALVREWLVTAGGYTNAPPTAALMKAVVTGGAKGRSVPDNAQGWGRVDLEETLFPSNRAVKLFDRIPFAAGTNFTYVIETTNAAPLDVQLVWIDCPSAAGGSQQTARLVNDLNLSVEAMTNAVSARWWGNGGTAADDRNTSESVRIDAAPPAKYVITIFCANVVYDHEDGGAAALYVRGAFDPAAAPDPPELVTVTVGVKAGAAQASVSPATGTSSVFRGERIEFSASEWAYEYGSQGTPCARHAFLDFVGSGDAPASGTNRTFSAVISNDTTVTWRYATEVADYLFTYIASLSRFYNGTWIVQEEWLPKDFTFTLSLPEEAAEGDVCHVTGYYHNGSDWRCGTYDFKFGMAFYARTDETNGYYMVSSENGRFVKSLEITMDEGIDLYCDYFNVDERTTDGLPYWWYTRYLFGGERLLGYDASATGDPDGDGFANAAEYADGTDPVDDTSFRFKVDSFSPTNMTFTGSIKGSLVVERCETLGGDWTPVCTQKPPRASTTNRVNLIDGGTQKGFYRVRYRPD